MNRVAALTLAGTIALGTVACASASAPHTPAPVSTVKPASEWQVPSSVATPALVPIDNIAPDKSYSGYQGPVVVPAAPIAAPMPVAPAYVPPAVVYVTGTPVAPKPSPGTVAKAQAPAKTPSPTPVAVPTPQPTPEPTVIPIQRIPIPALPSATR